MSAGVAPELSKTTGAAETSPADKVSVAKAKTRCFPMRRFTGVSPFDESGLTVVRVAAFGGRHGRGHQGLEAGQHPRALAVGEARGEVAVVDFAGHGEPVIRGRRQEEARVVVEAVTRAVDVPVHGGDDAVPVLID